MARRPESERGLTRRQLSRAAREARMQKAVTIGTISVISAVAVLLIGALVFTQIIQPRQRNAKRSLVVATMDGADDITVGELQDRALFEYYFYILQLQSQQQQPQGIPPSFFAQIALESLIEERVLDIKAEEYNIVITEEELTKQRELQLSQLLGVPFNAFQLFPTSTPSETPEGPTATATATSTLVYTPTPSPTVTLDPLLTLTPTSTPTDENAPTATPTETGTPPPTFDPLPQEDYDLYYNNLLAGAAQFIEADDVAVVEAIWETKARASIIREKLPEAISLTADQTKFKVHSAHILTATEEEANAALARIEAGDPFEVVAADVSTDGTALRGGDLGWFGPGQMVEAFEEVAFNIPVGEISDPFETQFGWHILTVYDRVDVPATAADQQNQIQERLQELLTAWRDDFNLFIDEDTMVENLPDFPQ